MGPKGSTIDTTAIKFLSNHSIKTLLLSPTFASPAGTLGQLGAGFELGFLPTDLSLVPGPYLAKVTAGQVSLSKIYGLISDLQEAFMNGFTPNDDGSFSYVTSWDTAQYGALIPVPSKLYTSLLDRTIYPLAGLRFAVKDLANISRILTSGGSRAMLRLYNSPPDKTAPAIQDLLDLGAVLVGKTKLTVFAFGAYAYQNDDFSVSPWTELKQC